MQQQDLAKLIGKTYSYISKIEKPDGPTPAPETIADIARALRLSEEGSSELFELAQRIPPAVQQLIEAEPEAVAFYRAVNRNVSDGARRDFFRKLIEEIEGEAAGGSGGASGSPAPEAEP